MIQQYSDKKPSAEISSGDGVRYTQAKASNINEFCYIPIREGRWSRRDFEYYTLDDLYDEVEDIIICKENERRAHIAQEKMN